MSAVGPENERGGRGAARTMLWSATNFATWSPRRRTHLLYALAAGLLALYSTVLYVDLSNLGIWLVITRHTRAAAPRCTMALMRKRDTPARLMAKLHSLVLSNSSACLSSIRARAMRAVWSAVSGLSVIGVSLPSSFMAGGKPAVMNRSEPLLCTRWLSRPWMNFFISSL